MIIEKSSGQTPTEKYLSQLCDRTFLKVWCYANPFKSDGKELCDLLAVFENHVFLFFDRESRKFANTDKDIALTWERWKREAIDKQIRTAACAKNYIERHRKEIYLDPKCTIPFPVTIPTGEIRIHKIVVAHGAKEACENFSGQNVSGSLAINYGHATDRKPAMPFIVSLDRTDPIHVFDSHNLEIILAELDTVFDFEAYLTAKEQAIEQFDFLTYCGEEDLLAHYLYNYDSKTKSNFIGVRDKSYNGVMIGEGEWRDFERSLPYRRKKEADRVSYLWDDVIQRTCQNALNGTLLGDADVFNAQSAIHEMAKESRLSRRAISEILANAIKNFPDNASGIVRHLSFLPSLYKDKGYIFLQLRHPNIVDYENEYRPVRRKMLEIACGVAKNRFTYLNKIIGIAIDAPKYSEQNSEDFILMDCKDWPDDVAAEYAQANEQMQFFATTEMKMHRTHVVNFPNSDKPTQPPKIGRNQKCPCGSGKKWKRCHGR